MRVVLTVLFLFLVALPVQAKLVDETEKASDAASSETEANRVEHARIAKLWQAAITRSPDINFVLQKLKLNDQVSLNRILDSVLNQAISPQEIVKRDVLMIADPSMGDTSYTKVRSIVHDQTYAPLAEKRPRRTVLTKETSTVLTSAEQIQLLNMLRSVAHKLVYCYRTYVGLSSTSRKEIPSDDQRARARQDLIDICGADAISELDSERDPTHRARKVDL